MRYVALSTFVDPTDGTWIKKGRTHVSGDSDVHRMYPHRFKALERSAHGVPGIITRVGGIAMLADYPPPAPRPRQAPETPLRCRRSVAIDRSAGTGPYWQLAGQPEPWRLQR